MIRVLIVEDSPVVREFLVYIFSSDPDIRIAGIASDGEEAIRQVARDRPDVITMDIEMPRMNGLDATRRIMEVHPTPIVIVSGLADGEVASTFRAIEAGALAFVPRPAGIGHADHESTSQELIRMVKLMSEVKVVRRWPRRPPPVPAAAVPLVASSVPKRVDVVAIGASTGGPPVLQKILSELPHDFPVPLLVVQHMTAGFSEGFFEWLGQTSKIPVSAARQREPMLAGHAYVAPDGFQMKVGAEGRLILTADAPENGLRPSVSYLFRSLLPLFGSRVLAGLLTGMGRDGVDELKVLKDRGAVTFAQDEASSAVHGMPGEAIRLAAVTYILTPGAIAPVLTTLAKQAMRRG